MCYDKICFVAMPFGKKNVTDDTSTRLVDFDAIYRDVFKPAIANAQLPEGGTLEPRRVDEDPFSAAISQEMFQYLEHSRMVLVDITTANANVFYELGVRHRASASGTIIFRQLAAKIPFDINQIKAFPYEYEPQEQATRSREAITHSLTESLKYNRLDSPVRIALLAEQARATEEQNRKLLEAENALRAGDRAKAIVIYRKLVALDPGSVTPCMRLGLLLKDEGQWAEAIGCFERASAMSSQYAEAWRELGIARNKLYIKSGKPAALSSGLDDLMKAIVLNPDDYDAHASLGGILKREGKLEDALRSYERAVDISNGNSYPLLNALKLRAQVNGAFQITGKDRWRLQRAERSLQAQVATDPAYDPPWSFFDLAEIKLFGGKPDEFRALVEKGVDAATEPSQVETFYKSLRPLADVNGAPSGVVDGVSFVKQRLDDIS